MMMADVDETYVQACQHNLFSSVLVFYVPFSNGGFYVVWFVISVCIPMILWGCPRGVMVKAMDCGIIVSEYVLQSLYHVHFRANTLGKGMNPLILQAMGLIVPLLFF